MDIKIPTALSCENQSSDIYKEVARVSGQKKLPQVVALFYYLLEWIFKQRQGEKRTKNEAREKQDLHGKCKWFYKKCCIIICKVHSKHLP